MATRWACLGAGRISWDFFLAMRENLPRAEHEVMQVFVSDYILITLLSLLPPGKLFMLFLSSVDFFKINFSKKYFRNTI